MEYPFNGYPRGYEDDTYFIFIQWSGHVYHIIRVHEYPYTSICTVG